MNKKNLICFGQCVTAGIVAAFITHILIQYFGGYIEACQMNEKETHCLREWVSALSGWVAAAGALIAALLTIPHLMKQAHEANRQTDFIIGNTPPIMEVIDRNGPGEIWVKIINWNRNTFYIDEIITPPQFNTKIEKLKFEPNNIVVTMGEGIKLPIRISGYEDRSKAPSIVNIYIKADGGVDTQRKKNIYYNNNQR
jgi:hypothetical protein